MTVFLKLSGHRRSLPHPESVDKVGRLTDQDVFLLENKRNQKVPESYSFYLLTQGSTCRSLRVIDECSVPEMRIWSVLFIKIRFKLVYK